MEQKKLNKRQQAKWAAEISGAYWGAIKLKTEISKIINLKTKTAKNKTSQKTKLTKTKNQKQHKSQK